MLRFIYIYTLPTTPPPLVFSSILVSFYIQVRSNEPDAIYELVQKERVLKFPFSITANGEILLTEQLDREQKSMVDDTFVQ